MKKYATLVLILCATMFVHAQEYVLPKGLAQQEIPLIPAYRDSRAGLDRGITTPPDFPVRTMAEWEEVQALVISWQGYSRILKQIVRHAKEECEVIIVCDDPAIVTTYLMNGLAGGPIEDMTNISFLQAPSNSIWIRDYGPEVIYANDVDSLMLLDWIYNRPRPADDALSDVIATHLGLPVYSTTQAPYDLVHTGGNFMADGFGTAFSSKLVLLENGPQGQFNQTNKNEQELGVIMQQFMGIQQGRYILMDELPFDNISHIDMHMKLLDEETLLVGEFPVGVSDGPQIETNIGHINTYNSVFDTPYEYVRIPMVPSVGGNYPPAAHYRTFANNIFINGTVLVPTYREQYDTTGLRILREALPGYKVIGIDCDDQGAEIIASSGAIHCITKTIGVAEPLLIRHQRLRDTYDTTAPYQVDAWMRHKSGILDAHVYWTADTTQPYTPVPMIASGGDNYTAFIPAQAVGTEIFYYIEGRANSGKVQVRPLVAPDGWWRFEVLDIISSMPSIEGPVITEVFPNPTSSILVVTIEGTGDERVHVAIHDALGREVMKLHDGQLPQDNRIFADIAHLSGGAYLLVVGNSKGRTVHRVVKR